MLHLILNNMFLACCFNFLADSGVENCALSHPSCANFAGIENIASFNPTCWCLFPKKQHVFSDIPFLIGWLYTFCDSIEMPIFHDQV